MAKIYLSILEAYNDVTISVQFFQVQVGHG